MAESVSENGGGRSSGNGLCLVFATVRQPSYRTQIRESTTNVTVGTGDVVEVAIAGIGTITNPVVRWEPS